MEKINQSNETGLIVPVASLVGLVRAYNTIHDCLFKEHAESPNEFYYLISRIEIFVDEKLREQGINPEILHEFLIEDEERGGTIENAFHRYQNDR